MSTTKFIILMLLVVATGAASGMLAGWLAGWLVFDNSVAVVLAIIVGTAVPTWFLANRVCRKYYGFDE